MTAREVVRKLLDRGCVFLRQNGSHARYRSACGKCFTTVPMHTGDMRLGTLRGIQADMEPCLGKGWLL